MCLITLYQPFPFLSYVSISHSSILTSPIALFSSQVIALSHSILVSMNSEALFETVLDAKVLKVVMRFKNYNDSSRSGTSTEEWFVKDMIKENMLIEDPVFDDELQKIMDSGDFWVEAMDDPSTIFPRADVFDITEIQSFFIDIMAKFSALCTGDKLVYRAGPDGKYNVSTKLGVVTCMPDASVYNTPTIGSRRPDVNIYYQSLDTKGILRIVSSWELNPRGSKYDYSFSLDEIGKVIETSKKLMRKQPFRMFTLAVLSDGVRFVFFKIMRLGPQLDDYKVLQSSTYLNMQGWAVRIAEHYFKSKMMSV